MEPNVSSHEHTHIQARLDSTFSIQEMAIDDLEPNPDQSRKFFDEEDIGAMSLSIGKIGIKEPIKYIEKEGKNIIFSGEIRWRAAKNAGLSKVPAIRIIDPDEAGLINLIDNIAHHALLPMEEALAIKSFKESANLYAKDLGEVLGMAKSSISERLKIAKLPEEIQNVALTSKDWTAQRLIQLARAKDKQEQSRLFGQMKSLIKKKQQNELETNPLQNDGQAGSTEAPNKDTKRYIRIEKTISDFKETITKRMSFLVNATKRDVYSTEMQAIKDALDSLLTKIEEAKKKEER